MPKRVRAQPRFPAAMDSIRVNAAIAKAHNAARELGEKLRKGEITEEEAQEELVRIFGSDDFDTVVRFYWERALRTLEKRRRLRLEF